MQAARSVDDQAKEQAAAFSAHFGRDPDRVAAAPGRVNLIGEHTDYSEGLVAPCAIDRATVALVADGGRDAVRGFASDLDASARTAGFAPGDEARPAGWIAYVWGVHRALAERGLEVGGHDLAVSSTVPLGSGLSSSAALCVAVTTALDAHFGLGLGDVERARIAHRAESHFVGVGCGLLDPFASALGREGHALRIDCRTEAVERVPLPAERLALLVAHSGVERTLAAEDGPTPYQERVAACREAVSLAREAGIGPADATALRDFGPEDLPALAARLPDVVFRRARHVVSENARVDALCAALARGDLDAVGGEVRACQASLRDDYEVSVPELDALCEIGDALPGVFGSRLTGAGWGGCTLHLVDPVRADAVGEALAEGFARRFGRRPPVHRMAPAGGARVLDP